MDETKFLSEYYKKNRCKDIEIIGVAYELSEDFEEARRALKPFMARFDVDYPVLITGVTADDTLCIEKTLPQIIKSGLFPPRFLLTKRGNKITLPSSGTGHSHFFQTFALKPPIGRHQ